jgi:hypothetical protein
MFINRLLPYSLTTICRWGLNSYTKIEEIPDRLQFYFGNEKIMDFNKVNWNPNFEYDCIVSDDKIRAWLFTIKGSEQKKC